MKISRAAERDLRQVQTLLRAAELPEAPRDFPRANLIVGLEGPLILGAVGLEVCGLLGVLAFAVVAEEKRRKGIGTSLVQALVARANELGLRELYVFASGCPEFFRALGFVELPRDAVPAQILSSRAGRECAASDPILCLEIAARYM